MSYNSPTLADMLDANSKQLIADLHTSLPCRVIRYAPETQSVDVQPLLSQQYSNGWVAELPIIQGVPVVFTGSSNSLISFPLNKGDIVLAVFAERSIDKWVSSDGGIVNPSLKHRHDLSDAFVIPGLHTHRTHNNPNPDNLEVRFNPGKSNETSVKMKSDGSVDVTAPLKVNVITPEANYTGNVNVAGDVIVEGDTVASGVSLVNHTHGGVAPGGSNTGVPN